MTRTAAVNSHRDPAWLVSLIHHEPRAPLMLPYLAYLFLLMFAGAVPDSFIHVAIALHTAAALYFAWLFRNHLPAMGRPMLYVALPVGLVAAWLWVVGQHYCDTLTIAGRNLGGRLPLYPGTPKPFDPVVLFGGDYRASPAFWSYAVLKITRAATAVPVVEELFWRGFILRAFISWSRPEDVPLGKFTLYSFLGSSLLSVLQHPDNWGVSIACWMLFNMLFYWTRSLWCLIFTHAFTNIALYIYVIHRNDWRFW